jgi:3-hydroxyacyl-CoA dehydrogenase
LEPLSVTPRPRTRPGFVVIRILMLMINEPFFPFAEVDATATDIDLFTIKV